ncbi:NPCC-domain-containing protein [Daldinia caldariorum]|uniref:NPCC-domain-containing protein n=1 Tax=Daldinia caldariorum TaxID=326644 RepID=UPI002008B1F7|nr:NPCC-domain-containing protein [Daldinia caldariorum]KAI1469703.1 NPCC-domain-containing protein [Daldinia caldariorum]
MSLSMAKTIVTPKKSTPATPPPTDSPGTWRHPRLEEITQRQEATTFSDKNIKRIAVNIIVLITLIILHSLAARALPSKKSFPYAVWSYARYAYWAVLAIPLFNIGTNLLPLIRPKDDLSDIPLTPGQRQLLGLPPSSAPPTPGSAYSTPPRYSRTPSISGSTGSKRSFSSPTRSPASNYGSLSGGNGNVNLAGLGSPQSPLLQKAMNGARRSSISSLGSSGMLGASTGFSSSAGFSSSFYGGVPDSPSPSPVAGKRNTVGLSSKWMYERAQTRKNTTSNAWLYN